jgi:hypothetical protein
MAGVQHLCVCLLCALASIAETLKDFGSLCVVEGEPHKQIKERETCPVMPYNGICNTTHTHTQQQYIYRPNNVV